VAETTPTPSSGKAAALRRGETQPGTRALVIDGDQGTLAFAAEALSSFAPGLEVATARDLQQAGAWVESFRPHIIFVSEPLAAELLKHPTLRDADAAAAQGRKFVLMSGWDAGDARPEVDTMRFDRILPKPLHLQTLLTAVRAILKARDDH
jgi:DNA-binding response OmpR family regulator